MVFHLPLLGTPNPKVSLSQRLCSWGSLCTHLPRPVLKSCLSYLQTLVNTEDRFGAEASFCTDYSFITGRKLVTVQWRRQMATISPKQSELTSQTPRPFSWETLRTQCHLSGMSVPDAYSKFNHEEISDKPRQRDILQNNWTEHFRSADIPKTEVEELV